MATDKTRYKDVKVRIPEEELAVLNCRVAKTGMSREQYIRCLIADTIPAEYPPADYRLIIRKLDELQEVMEALVDENPVKRDAMKLYITLQNVASTADVLRRAVMPFVSRREKNKKWGCCKKRFETAPSFSLFIQQFRIRQCGVKTALNGGYGASI